MNRDQARDKLTRPHRSAYGPTEAEMLDVYRTDRDDAPIQVFIHGGGWRIAQASDYALMAYHAQLDEEGDAKHPPLPEWWARVGTSAPVEVRFAHDLAIWRPG